MLSNIVIYEYNYFRGECSICSRCQGDGKSDRKRKGGRTQLRRLSSQICSHVSIMCCSHVKLGGGNCAGTVADGEKGTCLVLPSGGNHGFPNTPLT